MAEWCENELEVSGKKADVRRFLGSVRSHHALLEFEKIVPSPADYRPDEGPGSGKDLYAWRMENWGTKWDTDNPTLEELDPDESPPGVGRAVLLAFATANTPPLPVVKAAAAKYPALTFRLSFWMPEFMVHGVLEAEGGRVVREEAAKFFGHRRARDHWP